MEKFSSRVLEYRRNRVDKSNSNPGEHGPDQQSVDPHGCHYFTNAGFGEAATAGRARRPGARCRSGKLVIDTHGGYFPINL